MNKANISTHTKRIVDNPFERSGARKNSVYIGDTAFGDSGKGVVTAEFNRMLAEKFGKVYSLRINGGGNAGHDMEIDGIPFLANQLPAAVAQQNGVALITRGMVFNPGDGVMEIERTFKTFGGKMPGSLQIDERTPLCLDTHKVLDRVEGSTGRGIGPAYADFYARKEVTIKDLMSENWEETLGKHFDEKLALIKAISDDTPIFKRLDNSQSELGTKAQFLERLSKDRQILKEYVNTDMRSTLQKIWADESIPVTIEEAQGPGLDPYSGIRPDVTSSRPGARYVHDSTYGTIFGETIALKLGVTKTLYMSSVGSRRLPAEMPPDEADFFHTEFDEFGKTTKRKRGVYYLSLPILKSMRKFSLYDYLVATHIDAGRESVPVKVVTGYTNEKGEVADFGFYQDEIDKLTAKFKEFPGWDGEKTKLAKTPNDLEQNALEFLEFLSLEVAPVIMARNGKNLGNHIVWWDQKFS